MISDWKRTTQIIKSIDNEPTRWKSHGCDAIGRDDSLVVMDCGVIFSPLCDFGDINAMRISAAVARWRRRNAESELENML